MAVTATSFKADPRFSEFAATDTVLVAKWITYAYKRVNEVSLGTLVDDAVSFLTAHYLRIDATVSSGGSSPSGPAQSLRSGNESVTFMPQITTFSSRYGNLRATDYGLAYLEIVNNTFAVRSR